MSEIHLKPYKWRKKVYRISDIQFPRWAWNKAKRLRKLESLLERPMPPEKVFNLFKVVQRLNDVISDIDEAYEKHICENYVTVNKDGEEYCSVCYQCIFTLRYESYYNAD